MIYSSPFHYYEAETRGFALSVLKSTVNLFVPFKVTLAIACLMITFNLCPSHT